jgi:hypothetical protein
LLLVISLNYNTALTGVLDTAVASYLWQSCAGR